MNHFKCPHNPSMCEHSVFFESSASSDGIRKRWVECVEYQFVEDPVTQKMRRVESEEFKLEIDGDEVIVKKGYLCVNRPVDWWEDYNNSIEKGML